MAIFSRRSEPPPQETDYSRYRQYVREDFVECCAYCLLHEFLAAGEDNFELDHFFPASKSTDPARAKDYYNLYYTCHICNHYKAACWPSPELEGRGYRFIDSCKDGFAEHFEARSDGLWMPLTPAAEYTTARIRLNRTHLVKLRSLLNEIGMLKEIHVQWDMPLKSQLETLLL